MQSDNNHRISEDLSLHELAANNYVQNLTYKLLTPGQDVNIRNDEMQTPLHLAAECNRGRSHLEVAEILLNNGADPNVQDSHNCTPLWYLVLNGGNVDLLKLFSRFKADFTSFNGQKKLLFKKKTQAIESSNLDVYQLIVSINVNHKDESINEMTLLHVAAAQNKNESHYEIIKFLLEIGSCVNARDFEGTTPLYYVIRTGNLKVLDLFLSYKADFGMVENIFFEFFNYNSDVEVLKKLFLLFYSEDSGLDVNQTDLLGRTPLHYAVNFVSRSESIDMKIIKCLLKKGANINAANNNGMPPLIGAVSALNNFTLDEKENASYFADFLIEQTDFSGGFENFYGQNNNFGNLIMKHLAKLKFLNICVDQYFHCNIEFEIFYKDYFHKCTKELEVMSNTKLQNSWLTFFNLLIDNRRKLKNYTGNEDLIEDYKNNDWSEIFPIYGDSLKRNVDKGIRRRELFDKSSILLSDCLPIFNPNHLIIKDILDCVLSKKDLSKFLCK